VIIQKRQTLIYIIAALLVTDFVFLGYMPSRQRLKSVKQARAKQLHVIAKASAENKQRLLLEQQLQSLQRLVTNYEKKVPTERDLGLFLKQIANLMTKHNLTEQVVAPAKEIEADGLNCIPVDIKCKGKLTQLFEFYNDLAELDRLVRIEQVILANDEAFIGIVDMHTKAVIYYRTQKKQV